MVEAMVTITSAANVIDAVYGSVRQVDPWKPPGGRKPGAKRQGEIIEQLKQSFGIGKYAWEWSQELEWLFNLRDDIVHHAEKPRPMVIAEADAQDIVLSATEGYSLTAISARRAVDFVDRILSACFENPRPKVVKWAERSSLLRRNFGKMPGPSGPRPVIRISKEGEDRLLITAVVPEKPDAEGESGSSGEGSAS
jgi:hypothetical protein